MALVAEKTQALYGKAVGACTEDELFRALMALCRERMDAIPENKGERKLYYVSAEFLLGRLLANNLLNLGLYEEVTAELQAAGKSIAAIEAAELEPALGNGGLGRLAACFLDSIATLGLPGDGVGLLYHNGLFRQRFRGRCQTEEPEPWLKKESWLRDTARTFTVPFGGFTVRGKLYELDVPGYGGGKNRLRLFDLDTDGFSPVGPGIEFDKTDVRRNLTLFLYPDDSDEAGRLLRVYQQYFMVSCAAQLVLQELEGAGHKPEELDQYAVIQINDTHPSMIIPELVRLLIQKGVEQGRAMDLVARTCAYTNHTILAEALEKWPLAYLERAVPHLVPVIRALDEAVRPLCAPGQEIIDAQGTVHMARMDIHYTMSVNGVAALHTQILKETELKSFCALYPQKFNNKTNGITFRRWLMGCDPALAGFISRRIGEGWKRDAGQLEKLLAFQEEGASLDELLAIKQQGKQQLAASLLAEGIELDTNSVFDVQIKRLHEYKRQQMNALYLIWKYREIKAGRLPARPVTALFGAKAAPAYTLAKDIIHLILGLADLIAGDPEVSPWLKVVMVENYNVSRAELLIPAAEISEQISLASKEASGTGNMKLMLNGALTLGTLDGANVEIAQLVGEEIIYLFGKHSDEVIGLYKAGAYNARALYKQPEIEPLVDFIISKPMMELGDPVSLARLYKDMTRKDWFMTLLDVRAYIARKEQMLADYEDRRAWAQKMLRNIAHAGFFSSDRTIAQYNADIWHL